MPAERWRNAIVNYRVEQDAAQLLAHPLNPRRHPKPQQDALSGAIGDLGWLAPVVVNVATQHVLDGHLRIELAISRGEPVPVIEVDLPEELEAEALLTFDPIGNLAVVDQANLDALLRQVDGADADVAAFLASVAAQNGLIPPTDPLAEWQGMPPFEQEDLGAVKQLIVSFASLADYEAFGRLVEQKLTPQTKSIWYPAQAPIDYGGQVYVSAEADGAA